MKKQVTDITERNGGVHSQKAMRRINAMLLGHDFSNPRLYHIVMTLDTDDGQGGELARYQRALKALCLMLTKKHIHYRWRACFERDPEKDLRGKGAHFHLFLLVEAKSRNNPCGTINHHRNWPLSRMMHNHRVSYHIAQPKDDIHRTAEGKRKNYASLAGAKMADCLEWVSYLVKKRSKPTDTRQIYFSSRDSITKGPKPKSVITGRDACPRVPSGTANADDSRQKIEPSRNPQP